MAYLHYSVHDADLRRPVHNMPMRLLQSMVLLKEFTWGQRES